MKKIALFVALALLWGGLAAYGQNFTYTAPIVELPGAPGSTILFFSFVENLENFDVTFWVEMDTSQKPDDWLVQFCSGIICWPPWVLVDSNFVIRAGRMDTVRVDVYPDSFAFPSEDCWVTMSVYPAGHPELTDSIAFHVFIPEGVKEEGSLASTYALPQVYPNPFNGSVAMALSLPAPDQVDVNIFDLAGRNVDRIYDGLLSSGEHKFTWEPGENAAGIYLMRIGQGGKQIIRKVVYLR